MADSKISGLHQIYRRAVRRPRLTVFICVGQGIASPAWGARHHIIIPLTMSIPQNVIPAQAGIQGK